MDWSRYSIPPMQRETRFGGAGILPAAEKRLGDDL